MDLQGMYCMQRIGILKESKTARLMEGEYWQSWWVGKCTYLEEEGKVDDEA